MARKANTGDEDDDKITEGGHDVSRRPWRAYFDRGPG